MQDLVPNSTTPKSQPKPASQPPVGMGAVLAYEHIPPPVLGSVAFYWQLEMGHRNWQMLPLGLAVHLPENQEPFPSSSSIQFTSHGYIPSIPKVPDIEVSHCLKS